VTTDTIPIRGCSVLPLRGAEEVREGIDLLIEGGRVAAMGPALAPARPDRVVEARLRLTPRQSMS
jgi:hypothetical protein